MATSYQIYFLLELSFFFITLIILKNLLPHALENPLDFILAIVLNALNIAIDRLNIHLNFYIRCSNFHMFNV